ncbi:CLC_0170 family protein [Clostridium sp.]
MRILGLFDMYFLTMMIIQGAIVLSVDAKSFKNSGNDVIGRKAHILGWLAIIISMILFILRAIF